MVSTLAETLRQLRAESNLSQQQLADQLFVDRSSIAHWEAGRRTPNEQMIPQLARCLGVDPALLFSAAKADEGVPNVILVDDEKIILTGGLPVLEEALPGTLVTGFTRATEAIAFAQEKHVALAFLDIEMGKISGLELCRQLLEIDPRTNVIFLTAFMQYSYDAWETGACGFILKPITAEAVRRQLPLLRYPLRRLEER